MARDSRSVRKRKIQERKTGEPENGTTVQSILDGVLPKMIPMALTLGCYFLMKGKGWTPVKCIGALLVLGLVGALIGIF